MVEASGGEASLEYRFEVFSQSAGAWTLERDYTSAPTWTWTPTVADLHAIRVSVREVGTSADFDAQWESGEITVGSGPIVNTSMTINQTVPTAVPVPLVFTAHARGGTAPLEYKFYLYDLTVGTWTLAQDWTTSNQWSWMPGHADYGVRAVQVWIRSIGSAASYEAYTGTGYFVLVR